MVGRITRNGYLFIMGRGAMICPFSNSGDFCGHSCPLFGEPRTLHNGESRLPICQGRELFFDVNGFVDERGKDED